MATLTPRATKHRELPPAPRNIAPGDQRAEDRGPETQIGLVTDPMDVAIAQEFVENINTHGRFTSYALRQMARSPWAATIIQTRLNHVRKFSYPQQDPHSCGFAVRMRDKKASPSRAALKVIDDLTEQIQNCGELREAHEKFTRQRFPDFLQGTVRDSLVLDSLTAEFIPAWTKKAADGGPKPVRFQSLDAGTIFRATPNNLYGDYGADDCQFMQIVNEQQVARWRPGELAFGVRRPRTDLNSNGYGHPELTEMVEIVLGLQYALVHNSNIFKNGGPRGVLSVLGGVPERQFRGFQKQLTYAATGFKNAFRMVLINPQGEGAGVQWVPFGAPNREMEFAEWNNFLYRIMCALWQIDPGETGIYMAAEGDAGHLFGEGPEAKLLAGRDKGLLPLLMFIADVLNLYYVQRLAPDFEFTFQGIGALSEKEQAELDKMRLEGPYMLNEVRARQDLAKLPPEQGDVFMHPGWQQAIQARMSAQGAGADGSILGPDGKPMAAPGGQPGAPGGEPQPPPPLEDDDGNPPIGEAGKAIEHESAVHRLLRIEINL